jgi:hypothetical protein
MINQKDGTNSKLIRATFKGGKENLCASKNKKKEALKVALKGSNEYLD